MGVDAYLLTSSGRWLHVGRAYHLEHASVDAALEPIQEDLAAMRQVPAERLEDYGLAMLRRADADDDRLARQLVLFARDCKGETVRMLRDIDDDFALLLRGGAFRDELEWDPPGEEAMLAIDGTCPRCGSRPRGDQS